MIKILTDTHTPAPAQTETRTYTYTLQHNPYVAHSHAYILGTQNIRGYRIIFLENNMKGHTSGHLWRRTHYNKRLVRTVGVCR